MVGDESFKCTLIKYLKDFELSDENFVEETMECKSLSLRSLYIISRF